MILTNAISRLFGKFATTKFPKFIQNFINKTYVDMMKLDMSEFDDHVSYETLNKLFTRKLKTKRDIDDGFISPVDAFISKMGKVQNGTLFQIKGKEYSLQRLLTKNYAHKASALEDGDYANFYLSPKDYHRYHIPCDMQVLSVTHVPGKLYPVNFKYLNKVANLFIENERVIIEAKTGQYAFFIVLVGALNVGKMIIDFEPDIDTNTKPGYIKKYTYSDLHLKKGEEFGYFMMGSTAVTVTPKGMLDFDLHESSKVKFGEKIASVL